MTIECKTDGTGLVFLLDVDNTLLDNDRLKVDLAVQLTEAVGEEGAARFWQVYERVRQQEDVVDLPQTVQEWEQETHDVAGAQKIRTVLDNVPFKQYLYPHVLETIAHMWTLGTPVILSDGDSVFQPRKIRESGLESAVHGNVAIYIHKEEKLPEIFSRYPASHYVIVDDKPRILAAVERSCPTTFTTIFVVQGKYAKVGEYAPAPDDTVHAIGDLRHFTREQFEDSPPARVTG